MPALHEDEQDDSTGTHTDVNMTTRLPFPPVTPQHILNCSYHAWHPKYRTISPKARLVPLTQPFVEYLRADGILLPDDDDEHDTSWSDDHDSGVFSSTEERIDSDEEEVDVSAPWRGVHEAIKTTIADLGGRVAPKLNWSAPKDATWMSATNNMECRTANDVYLLLKSSDFVTHDLEHAFDDTIDIPATKTVRSEDIPYHLVLRKYVEFNPSVEFRCFVRGRKLIALCQRDLNHYDFLFAMQDRLQSKIQEFFDVRLRDTFPDRDFVFDVYIPAPHDRVWLVDINPWAPRTDPLLFSWLELLTMDEPPESLHDIEEEITFRIPIRPAGTPSVQEQLTAAEQAQEADDTANSEEDSEDDEDVDEEIWQPEFRLVRKGDPEAYAFNTPQYSAHKLPKDVVDASQSGEGLREFARDWKELLEKRRREDELADSDED